jgi:hypothetical protein
VTAELFSYYLIDTSKLRELGYQDLQNLINQFPYCQNLRFLIAKKSHVEDHPDFEKWLNLAATHSTDRSYLYQLLHEVDFQKDYVFAEEKFDLETLSTPQAQEFPETVLLEKEIIFSEKELNNKLEQNIPSPSIVLATEQHYDSEYSEEDDYDEPLVTLSDLLKSNVVEKEVEIPAEIENIVPVEVPQESLVVVENPAKEVVLPDDIQESAPVLPKPLPKSAFSSWKKTNIAKQEGLSTIQLVSEEEITIHKQRIESKMEESQKKKKKKDKKKKKNIDTVAFADQSLIPNEDLATETLAKILVQQGRTERAILMFEKLKLQIPEKSTFFAAEINKLT